MRLTDLNPHWVGAGGTGVYRNNPQTGQLESAPERTGVGMSCECPCRDPKCLRLFVYIDPPLDGGPLLDSHAWKRTGDTFETLTLQPSIQRIGGCTWHGFITNGEVTGC